MSDGANSDGVVRAYLRISKRTEESQSIDQQRDKATRWASLHRPDSEIQWYVDEGVSATKKVRRPARDRILADLQRGDVLLAMKVDRLARSVADLLSIVKHAKERQASVALTDQSIDTSGAYGQFTVTLLGALAELEAGIIRERVSAAHETFNRDGRHGYGRVPYGFASVLDEVKGWKVIRPDPEAGPALRTAVLAVIDGDSIAAQARALGMPFNSLRKLMVNPRLYGMQPGGKRDPESALISAAEWRALQARLKGPKGWTTAPGYGAAFLCWHCRRRLYLNVSSKSQHGGTYVCAGDHRGRAAVIRNKADEFAEDWFLGHYGDAPVLEVISESDDDERLENLAQLDIDIDETLRRMRDARGSQRLTLIAELGRLQEEHDELEATPSSTTTRVVDTGQTMAERWHDSEGADDERTAMLCQVAAIVVHPASRPGGRFEVVDRQWTDGV